LKRIFLGSGNNGTAEGITVRYVTISRRIGRECRTVRSVNDVDMPLVQRLHIVVDVLLDRLKSDL
jgi:hypothetical protein